jgi:hypothetical protein
MNAKLEQSRALDRPRSHTNMISTSLKRARYVAATLLTASGIGSIAALWFVDISPSALAGALFGAVYLFISIGLYGQSRFALFTAIVIPACALWLDHGHPFDATPTILHSAQTAIACAAILFSAVVLIAVRNNPRI